MGLFVGVSTTTSSFQDVGRPKKKKKQKQKKKKKTQQLCTHF